GKGIYVVDQDVVFQSASGEALVVNENWTINNENQMRLEVTGRKQLKDLIRLTFVYEDGKRYFMDENGVKRAARVQPDLFDLMLPKEREVTFNNQTVTVTVNAVGVASNSPQMKSRLLPSSLNFGENPNLGALLPAEQVIKEFYSRLR